VTLLPKLQRERADTQRRVEAELTHRRAEEATRYDDAIRQAIEEGRREAQKKKTQAHLDAAKTLLARAEFEEALHEITKALRVDPSNSAARDLELTVYAARNEHQKRKASEHQQVDDQVRQYEQVHRRISSQARDDADHKHLQEQRDYVVGNRLQAAERFYGAGEYQKALTEIDAALTLDPRNPQARQLELAILSMQGGTKEADAASSRRARDEETWQREEAQRTHVSEGMRENLKRESLLAYGNILRTAWRDGRPSPSELEVLDIARESLKVSHADHASLEREIRLECYREALQHSLANGVLTLRDTQLVDALREKYGVPLEDQAAIEDLMRTPKLGRGKE
jgi:tetratricopeptide (TPR) repeat protein